MSIGHDWKKRLRVAGVTKAQARREEKARRDEMRAEETIAKLESTLAHTKKRRCLVMSLEYGETTIPFEKMYGKKFTTSEAFEGAAKTVAEYCLSNEMDIYIWEEDFSMSRGNIGAEIWVTP